MSANSNSTARRDYYQLRFEEFAEHRPILYHLVDNTDALNRRIAREAVNAIKAAGEANRQVMMILPVGPLDFSYWAELCNRERVSCEPLVSVNMDEYLDAEDRLVSRDHPLSFRKFMRESLVDPLDRELRPRTTNLHFPDPLRPEATTELVEAHGGADLCYGGVGISGHIAFNDPPEPDDPATDEEVRNWKTRVLTINRESCTQMAMGGVDGNWNILPRRAITVGMYEILLSKKIHLTFMRNWHAGTLRRSLFGPMNRECPASFVQTHSKVEVTLTRLAANVPGYNLGQATGEGEEE